MTRNLMGYEYIAQTLKEYDVTHVFYIEAILRMAMREMENMGMKCIMAHSENGAGYMADGYARATNKPGVAMCQSIGAGNMVGGIYDAYLANSPVIAVTGKKIPTYQYKNAYQEADHRLLYEGITKFNADIVQAEQIPYILRQCFREVTTGKARPVHIDIPNRMGRTMEVTSIKEPLYVEKAYKAYPAYRPQAEARKLRQALNAIEAAQRPVIVAGRGATVSGAGQAIYQLAMKADIPVVTSPDGKTLVDERDPIWAGIVGGYGMDCANRTAAAADLVIFIGTQAADQTTNEWKCPVMDAEVIQIDIDGAEIGRSYPKTIGLLGDARTVVEQLLAAVKEVKHPGWRKEVSEYVQATLDEYKAYQTMDSVPVRPERLCEEIGKALPDNAVVVADTGYSAEWSSTMIRMKSTQSYFRAAGSLGWAFPASLGIKCGMPDRPVFCFTGDGAMYYHVSEMETAARCGIKTITIVNNNQILGQCSGDLKQVHKDSSTKGVAHYTFTPVRFSNMAKEFGLNGILVEKAEDIGPAIEAALKAEKSTLIEVLTDCNASVPPALKG